MVPRRRDRGGWSRCAGSVDDGPRPDGGGRRVASAERRGVFTALLAWFVFRENVDRRVALGMLAIVAGAVVLSWSTQASVRQAWPAILVLAACLAWAIDNNLTRKLSLHDATWLAAIKGVVAGAVNLVIATGSGAEWPSLSGTVWALIIGAFAYGLESGVVCRRPAQSRRRAYDRVLFYGALRGSARFTHLATRTRDDSNGIGGGVHGRWCLAPSDREARAHAPSSGVGALA